MASAEEKPEPEKKQKPVLRLVAKTALVIILLFVGLGAYGNWVLINGFNELASKMVGGDDRSVGGGGFSYNPLSGRVAISDLQIANPVGGGFIIEAGQVSTKIGMGAIYGKTATLTEIQVNDCVILIDGGRPELQALRKLIDNVKANLQSALGDHKITVDRVAFKNLKLDMTLIPRVKEIKSVGDVTISLSLEPAEQRTLIALLEKLELEIDDKVQAAIAAARE